MERENNWGVETPENGSAGDTGYPNVGSSGLNTANQYNDEQTASYSQPSEPQTESGGATPPPPVYYTQPPVQPEQEPKKKRLPLKKIARSAVALVLAAAMGFAGGYVGAQVGGKQVVIQQVQRTEPTESGGTLSTSAGNGALTGVQVAEKVSPSVVVITTEEVVYSQWASWYGQQQVQSGAGSGVIISSDGYILTCAHVVSGASNVIVTIDDTECTATIVGEDSTSDIAVLKIEATGLTPATIGDSDTLKVGENVMAVGNPLGKLGGTVTGGMISALNRSVSITGSNNVTTTMSLIQMDASVSPGNSGGGLFNMAGELVGIVNAKSSSSEAEGLGFAIPINDAVAVAQDLMQNGYVSGRPYMGISYLPITDTQTAMQYGVSSYGVYIAEIVKGGPAEKAGLQAGDRFVSINDSEIVSATDLTTILQECKAGDTLEIVVARRGQMYGTSLVLGEKGAN